jgi:tripartite-type tricarboxylate transporter receptor subunit TctC
MKRTHSLPALTILALLATSVADEVVSAQSYPARPVKLIVPYPPGGGNDFVARILAQKLSENGGQFFVENHPGAGSMIGTAAAASAPADGHTLVVINQDFVVQPVVKTKVPYDPFKSFVPVILVATAPESISVHPSLPVTNFMELIELLKSTPGKYSVALPGYGTSPHLASEWLFKLTHHVDVVQVPFQGAAPAVTSTIAGHTQVKLNVSPGQRFAFSAQRPPLASCRPNPEVISASPRLGKNCDRTFTARCAILLSH